MAANVGLILKRGTNNTEIRKPVVDMEKAWRYVLESPGDMRH